MDTPTILEQPIIVAPVAEIPVASGSNKLVKWFAKYWLYVVAVIAIVWALWYFWLKYKWMPDSFSDTSYNYKQENGKYYKTNKIIIDPTAGTEALDVSFDAPILGQRTGIPTTVEITKKEYYTAYKESK